MPKKRKRRKKDFDNLDMCRRMCEDMIREASNPKEYPWIHTKRFAERMLQLYTYVEEEMEYRSEGAEPSPTALRFLITFVQTYDTLKYPCLSLSGRGYSCKWDVDPSYKLYPYKSAKRKQLQQKGALVMCFNPSLRVTWVFTEDAANRRQKEHRSGSWSFAEDIIDFTQFTRRMLEGTDWLFEEGEEDE